MSLCRFCFIKLNLLLIAIELAGDDGVDTTIAINPDSTVKIDLNFQGFFIAESADDVKRFVFSDPGLCPFGKRFRPRENVYCCQLNKKRHFCSAVTAVSVSFPVICEQEMAIS